MTHKFFHIIYYYVYVVIQLSIINIIINRSIHSLHNISYFNCLFKFLKSMVCNFMTIYYSLFVICNNLYSVLNISRFFFFFLVSIIYLIFVDFMYMTGGEGAKERCYVICCYLSELICNIS